MLNRCDFQGRLVKDPELRRVAEDKAVVSFTIACDRDYRNKDGEREADFIDCEAWGNDAEFISREFQKGDVIVLSGKLKTRLYDDREGKKRKSVTLRVTDEYFSGRRVERNTEGQSEEAEEDDNPFRDINIDDIF